MLKATDEISPLRDSRSDFVTEPLSAIPLPPVPKSGPPQRVSHEPFNFDRWYGEYRGLVSGLVARIIKDRETREDVCQNVWARIAKVGHRYDPSRAKETTFIGVITRRVVIDHLRREGGRLERTTRWHDGTKDLTPHEFEIGREETDPLRQAVRNESQAMILNRLKTLEPRQRDLLEGRFGSNLSLSQLAKELQMPLGTVKSVLWRTLEKLRREFPGEG